MERNKGNAGKIHHRNSHAMQCLMPQIPCYENMPAVLIIHA